VLYIVYILHYTKNNPWICRYRFNGKVFLIFFCITPHTCKIKIKSTVEYSSIIDINQFALLTFIIPSIMGGQDSSLLSRYRILKRSQRIALWVISLVLAMQHTYIQSTLYVKSREIHILSSIYIIPSIMGGQDSSLLSRYRILKRSRHFCDNINIFQ
jgi:hypothetical protein